MDVAGARVAARHRVHTKLIQYRARHTELYS